MSWPRKYHTFWCVIDSHGTAYLVSARRTRSRSIQAFLEDSALSHPWSSWRRWGCSCRRVDIKVRDARSPQETISKESEAHDG